MKLKSFGFQALIYTATNSISSALPILLLPILSKYLTVEEYGILGTLLLVIAFFKVILGLQSNTVIARDFFEDNDSKYAKFIGNSFMVLLANSLIMYILLFLNKEFIVSYLGAPFTVVVIVMIIGISDFIIVSYMIDKQCRKEAHKVAAIKGIQTVTEILLTLLFVVIVTWSWEGRVYAIAISSVVVSAIAYHALKKSNLLVFKFEKAILKESLSYGLPLIPHLLAAWIINASDRFFIIEMVGMEEAGIYTTAYQIGMFISLLNNSFNQAWTPWFFEKLTSGYYQDKITIIKSTYAYIGVILILASIYGYVAPHIAEIFIDSSFLTGSKAIMWIGLGFAVNGMYKMMVNYLFFIRKTKIIAISTVATAIINIILNYYLIKEYSYMGAAYATLISFIITFIFIGIWAARLYPMPWFFFLKSNNNG